MRSTVAFLVVALQGIVAHSFYATRRFCSRFFESRGSMLGMQRSAVCPEPVAPHFLCLQREPPNQTLQPTASGRTAYF
jgi:hypothetical protein